MDYDAALVDHGDYENYVDEIFPYLVVSIHCRCQVVVLFARVSVHALSMRNGPFPVQGGSDRMNNDATSCSDRKFATAHVHCARDLKVESWADTHCQQSLTMISNLILTLSIGNRSDVVLHCETVVCSVLYHAND